MQEPLSSPTLGDWTTPLLVPLVQGNPGKKLHSSTYSVQPEKSRKCEAVDVMLKKAWDTFEFRLMRGSFRDMVVRQ